jgi:signal transduction histidine kinase
MTRFRHMRRMLGGLVVTVLACALLGGAYLWGMFRPLDAALLDLQFRLTTHAATGDLVVVEIDPKSLSALDSWPWPRADHAELTDRLMAAGAKLVAFDVDFSSHSTADNDARLSQAFHNAAGRVVLPIFKEGHPGAKDESFTYSAPLEVFQRDARLGAVTVRPESDGRLWRGLAWDIWKGWKLPTIAGMLAGHGSDRDRDFLVDYSIDPRTLPQFSYVDILRGNFDPAAIAGKNVIVGATAVELGDRYAVPLYANLPGVIVQALAEESLAQGTALHEVPPIWILLLTFVLALPTLLLFRRLSWRDGAIAVVLISVAIFGGAAEARHWLALYLAVATPIAGVVAAYVIAIVQTLDLQALDIFNQQIEAAQRRALMRSVVESSPDGIVIADEDGTISMLNPAAIAMLGATAAEAVGTRIEALLPLGDATDAIDPLRIGVRGSGDIVLARPDDDELAVEITLSTSEIGPTQHPLERRRQTRRVFIYTLRDVTERKRIEEAQRAASAAAIANNRAKTEFLTNVSHELRTPLNAVIGFSEMIRNEIFGPVGEKRYVEYANDIHSAGSHLLEIINDILSISRIELGEMKLNESHIDVGRTIESVMRLVHLRAHEKSIAVETIIAPDLPLLWGDERAVKQMLLNVLSNAVKFSREGGWVRISAYAEASGGVIIAVADNGIGIAPEALEKIGQPFFQADASLQRSHEGLGLGLAIVRDLMRLHDGHLAIDSEPGHGVTATLAFPAARSGEIAPEPRFAEAV